MTNNAVFDLVPIWTAKTRLASLFDIGSEHISDTKFLEDSQYAFRKMGGLPTALIIFETTMKGDTLELPCNCISIEYVTRLSLTSPEAYTYYALQPSTVPILYDDLYTLRYYRNVQRGDYYPQGVYLDFEFYKENDTPYIRVKNPNQMVTVAYKGFYIDEEKNILITPDQAEALAYYHAFLFEQKQAFKEKRVINPDVRRNMNNAMMIAKTPTALSQNEMNAILNTLTSFHRHTYGRDTKFKI